MLFDKTNHAVFKLYYHLVLVVKYRQKVFNQNRADFARQILEDVARHHKISIEAYNWEEDHVHIMLTAEPTTNLAQFIASFKSCSSREIKKAFPGIRSKLWKSAFWSRSYCLLTTGGAPIEIVRRYIEHQRKNKNYEPEN